MQAWLRLADWRDWAAEEVPMQSISHQTTRGFADAERLAHAVVLCNELDKLVICRVSCVRVKDVKPAAGNGGNSAVAVLAVILPRVKHSKIWDQKILMT
jgi:hypothetical protein